MKKIIRKRVLIIFSILMMLGLGGCSRGVDADYISKNTETERYESEVSESEVVDNRVEITFSHTDVYYKHFEEVYSLFENLGFIDIDCNVSEMDYSVKEQYDGAVIAVQIDKEFEFKKGSLFAPELPVLISYVQDLRIQAPKSSVDCEGLRYTDVVKMFEDAGFTNVKAYQNEIEYTTKVTDRTVLSVSVDDNAVFDTSAKFTKDSEVAIYYYVILPALVESEENDSNVNQNNGNSSGSQVMVWIPQSGKKYHSRAGCSNMKNPTQVTKEEAESRGYTPCKKCY